MAVGCDEIGPGPRRILLNRLAADKALTNFTGDLAEAVASFRAAGNRQ